MVYEDSFLWWLSGLIDGEGHFGLYPDNSSIIRRVIPSFVIRLRDDDREILHEIWGKIGVGRLYDDVRCYGGVSNAKPTCRFQVASLSDCIKLIDIIDRFPLKSKKKRDYFVWKRGILYMAEHGCLMDEFMLSLVQEIKDVRKYTK